MRLTVLYGGALAKTPTFINSFPADEGTFAPSQHCAPDAERDTGLIFHRLLF